MKKYNLTVYAAELKKNGIESVESLLLLTKEDLQVMNLPGNAGLEIEKVINFVKIGMGD